MEIEQIYDEIRKNPSIASKMAIKGQELAVYEMMRDKEDVRNTHVAKMLDISPQQAWGVLNRLHEKGYVCRTQKISESGGYEWSYMTVLNKKGLCDE